MSKETLDLDRLEQEARRRFNVDGLLYVFLGLLLLILGVSFPNPATAWIAAFGALLIAPASALRKRFTYPRIGYARFEMQPGVGRGIWLFALAALVVLLIMAFAGGGRFQPYLPIAFGFVMGLSFYFGASMYGLSLLDGLIVVMMTASGLVSAWLFDSWREATGVQFAVVGAVILVIGIAMFIRFLRTYPVLEERNANEPS